MNMCQIMIIYLKYNKYVVTVEPETGSSLYYLLDITGNIRASRNGLLQPSEHYCKSNVVTARQAE